MAQQQPEQTSQTPALAAIATAAIIGNAYAPQLSQLSRAFLAGRIARAELIEAASRVVVAAMHRARVAGAIGVEGRTGRMPTPLPIAPADQDFVSRSVRTVLENATSEPRRDDDQPTRLETKLTALAPHVAMVQARTSYAHGLASVIRAQKASGESVESLSNLEKGSDEEASDDLAHLEADPEAVVERWRFIPDAGACGRCLKRAEVIYPDLDSVPMNGPHPGCGCSVEPEYRVKETAA